MTKKKQTCFTVGHAANYDKGLDQFGVAFKKMGRTKDYTGGFALQTAADAFRLIEQLGEGRGWGVYEMEARWGKDTAPSINGWWHALLKDATIIRRVPAPENGIQ